MSNIQIKRYGNEHTMELRDHNGLKYLVFPKIEELGVVDHLFSTRIGGVSKGCFAETNLSYTRGDDKEAVDENYRLVADALGHGRTLDDFVCTFQTHTTNVKVITEEDRGKGPKIQRDYTDIDGLVTNVPGIILGTFHADCPPVFFIDPVKRAIGLSHSGWKGTKGRISAKTIEKMHENYGTESSDLICAIGPSICGPCYEIGEDVAKEFKEVFTEDELKDNELLVPYPNGKYRLYLWNVIRYTLLQSGVKSENIIVTDICTRCNPELLFSHRVHGEKRGNLCAFLSIKQ
ncbi:peptidoglycan editing factor PgeF [Butyrivibrio sp. CB08]|uniref:peptidoglycan editing factor PgeF n=1 Tax=Butyrivibrio sp. CB08 TaxID=2364879 RepID=UPI000EA8E346|nr:peptidoglycan editing factor PgeF [Butyrivibrio sp. CB08]RKM57499.1 peptidoglycan editing factor PgeF [Butyrivibrio sp. CB08]